jgi:hypothetical protein
MTVICPCLLGSPREPGSQSGVPTHSSIAVGEPKTHAGKDFEHTRGKQHEILTDYSIDETGEANNVVPVNERTQRQ